jgi:hypothetical protein
MQRTQLLRTQLLLDQYTSTNTNEEVRLMRQQGMQRTQLLIEYSVTA